MAPSPPLGEVVSFTTLHSPPEGFRAPLHLALVELEGGARLFCHGTATEGVKIGSHVSVEAVDSVFYFSHIGFTDRARSLAGAVPSKLSLPSLPSPPGAMSAAQLRAVAQTVRAQRQSISAMQAQLDAIDLELEIDFMAISSYGGANTESTGVSVRKGQTIGTSGSANGVAHLHIGQQVGRPRFQ